MRTIITLAGLAFLATPNHVSAFAPSPSALTRHPFTAKSSSARFAPVILFEKESPEVRDRVMDVEVTPSSPIVEKKEDNKLTDPAASFFESLFQNLQNIFGNDQGSGLKIAALAMAVALAFLPLPSDAAMSGGRMGGSFSAPSQSRSYSGGSYSRGYSQGYSSGYYSRPSVTIAPSFGYSPFGFGFGNPFYYGGPGAITYSRGPGFFELLLFGGFAFAVASVFLNSATRSASSSFGGSWTDSLAASSSLGSGTSVVQLSVALEVPNRDDPNSILGVLERLADTARTDSRVGVQNLTSQVALELLRRRSSIVSASSSYKHFGDRNKAQREFQAKSIRERSKFEKETVSKYGGVDYGSRSSNRLPGDSTSPKATMAVVTLVMAIDGDSTKVPNINSISDVEEALRKIASDVKVDDCLQSAEILWTPEDRSETLSLRDVIADYPELRSI